MTDLPENVTAALDSETFDVFSFVSGAGTPLDTVTIYTDSNSAYRLAQIADQEAANGVQAETEGLGIADELPWADPEELDELKAKVEASALTFSLKGLAPAAKKAIRANLVAKHNFSDSKPASEQEPYFEDYTYTLIAKSIDSVRNASGAVDNRTWTPADVERLRADLHEGEFNRLDEKVYAVNFNTEIFDRAASADFLSKR